MRHIPRRLSAPVTVAVVTALAVPLTLPARAAEPAPPPRSAAQWQAPDTENVRRPSAVPAGDRAAVLGDGFAASTDTAFTTSGDGTGFHLLVAEERAGYAWKTAATLSEPGFDTDTWIGNACLTASGKRAAVAYAPRTFTNKPELMARGAFTAIVDLTTGKVTKLPFQASLAYFNPGCGVGEQAVFTQLSYEADTAQQTRLRTVDAVTGQAGAPVTYPGQVTSAVPTKSGVVAAHGNRLVTAGPGGKLGEITRTRSVPFQLTVDAEGGLTYIDRAATTDAKAPDSALTSHARHLGAEQLRRGGARPVTVASGSLTAWDLASSADGTVYVTGTATSAGGALPGRVRNPGGLAKGALLSSHGRAAVTTAWADGKDTRIRPEEALTERTARTTLRLLDTGSTVTLDAVPGKDRIGGRQAAEQGRTTSPALPRPRKASTGAAPTAPRTSARTGVRTGARTAAAELPPGSPTDPSEGESERTCAVPRNDVKKQAFQPTPRQVEWAVDQAVVGRLDFYRNPNWKNTGTGGYQPQGLFPPIVLAGDPNGKLDTEDGTNDRWHIPSQILLGVTAQESNMWQATRYAVPGTTSNSLIGNYYGVDYDPNGTQVDPWLINWADADCGYGITQATDGMRLPGHGQPTKSVLQQEAIALDYTANIAAGAQILSEKWNQTYSAGMKVNDGHPKWIENWFFALWAYNSGFYPQSSADSAGHWGVGWTNNPANPLWKANRLPFLENAMGGDNYADAAHPQDWPYEEKVIGWAARPLTAMFAPGDMQAGYRPAWWNTTLDRTRAKPPLNLFCDASNSCDPSKIADGDSNDQGKGACTLDSGNKDTNPHWLHCWWNKPVTWKNCGSGAQCGNQVHRFNTTYPEQPDANSYPPRCSSGLPANALIVDDVANGVVPAGSDARSCGAVRSDGTFTLNYYVWADGTYPGKMDTHQIGAAYGNHFWFTHTRKPDPDYGHRLYVNGVWKLNRPVGDTGQAKVFVHIPDHGAQTKIADYRITTAFGVETRTISQADNQSNKWVELGAFRFNDTLPEVSLSNFTSDGNGDKDIAWDAVAFVPGDYDDLNEVRFPEANPLAPDIDFVAAQHPKDAPTVPSLTSTTLAGPTGSTGSTSGAGAGCATGLDKVTLCSSYRPLHGPVAPDPSSRATGATAGTTTGTATGTATATGVAATGGWCKNVNGSAMFTRTEGCLRGLLPLTATKDGVPIGNATMKVIQEINLNPKTNVFTTWTELSLVAMTGITSTTLTSFLEECWSTTSCTESYGPWVGSTTWTTGDTHVATRTNTYTWNKVAGGRSVLDLTWETAWSTPQSAVQAVPKWNNNAFKIRCDNEVGGNSGCVFPHFTPTLMMNTKKYPAAASYYWVLMEKMASHPGSEKYDKPLHRLADDAKAKENRDKMCMLAVAEWDPHPNADGTSCDEYPFAKSRESGGMTLTSGKFCVQMYADKQADGTWLLQLDGRHPYPSWKEVCGRAAVPAQQNTDAGGDLGRFTSEIRLLDNDAYYVQTGFEGCDINSVCRIN
ncbi:golvesin C-terminal-like domain-containing protein [Streptomyces sp. NPDC003327]